MSLIDEYSRQLGDGMNLLADNSPEKLEEALRDLSTPAEAMAQGKLDKIQEALKNGRIMDIGYFVINCGDDTHDQAYRMISDHYGVGTPLDELETAELARGSRRTALIQDVHSYEDVVYAATLKVVRRPLP